MKKIYFLLFATLVAKATTAQFFIQTNYRGAFGPQATHANWASGWTDFNPEYTTYAATNKTVDTDITTNTTWSSSDVIFLKNKVYVKNGANLTIQPGCIIRGDKVTKGTLIISKGAKLIAEGTATNPIVFTTNQNVDGDGITQRSRGDWGGVILLGKATMNQGVANVEGIAPTTDNEYGGTDDADNSGILKYVRIEFAGVEYQPNKEINGLTLGAVGNGTKIDFIQVSFSNDDAFEWFGGSVNCNHLISYRNLDDDFDTDFGYHGNVQFGLIVRDPNVADNPNVSTSEGFESDNDATGSAFSPRTSALFSNITSVGPYRGNTNSSIATGYRRALRIRRNSSLSVVNSICVNWTDGLYVDGAAAADNFGATSLDSAAIFKNNTMVEMKTAAYGTNAGAFDVATYFNNNANQTKTLAEVSFVNPFPVPTLDNNGDSIESLQQQPDFRLTATTSAAYGNADYGHAKFGTLIGTENVRELSSGIQLLSLYPNPANESINIALNSIENKKTLITVTDITGRVLLSKTIAMSVGYNNYAININDFATGFYYMTVDNSTLKFIKE